MRAGPAPSAPAGPCRGVWLAALLLASAASAQRDAGRSGPDEETTPGEPIERLGGALLISGADGPGPDASVAFAELVSRGADAGDPPRILLVAQAAGFPAALESWRGELDVCTVALRDSEGARSAEIELTLGGVEGVWLHGADLDWLLDLGSSPTGTALRGHLSRGGVLGCSGGAARAVDAKGLAWLGGCDLIFGQGAHEGPVTITPGRAAVVIGTGASLLVDDRRMRALDGPVNLHLEASAVRPRDVRRLRPRAGVEDLVALTRAATARAGRPFPPDPAPAGGPEDGSLVLVGGGDLPVGTLERFIELAGGPDAPLVCVPCEEAQELEREPPTVAALRRAGARSVTWLHTKDRAQADDPEFLAPLRTARGIWFGGGRQWNLVDSYAGTQAARLFHEVLERGGVIGGSSAGASIQAEYLARGDPLGNRRIMAEGYERGFGFLGGCAVDQHFTQRGRQTDMLALKRRFPQLLGVGIDEGTVLEVRGDVGEVSGQGRVFFYDTRSSPADGQGACTLIEAGGRYDLARRATLD